MGGPINSVETLDTTRQEKSIDVLSIAFRKHSMLPPDPTGRRAHLMAVAIFDAFVDSPDATLFGISQEGGLAGVAFVFADGYEPSGRTLAWFLGRMVRVVGVRMGFTMLRLMSEKRSSDEQRLELMLLGAYDNYQRQGLGRTMPHHFFGFARERGYAAVGLEAAQQTPAFGFYQREGFLVERVIPLPTMPLCVMRRPLV